MRVGYATLSTFLALQIFFFFSLRACNRKHVTATREGEKPRQRVFRVFRSVLFSYCSRFTLDRNHSSQARSERWRHDFKAWAKNLDYLNFVSHSGHGGCVPESFSKVSKLFHSTRISYYISQQQRNSSDWNKVQFLSPKFLLRENISRIIPPNNREDSTY